MKRPFTLALLIAACLCSVSHADNFKINPLKQCQTVEGWGVSLYSWANRAGNWNGEKADSIVSWLTGRNGLNYNYFRYNLTGGDDSLHRHCPANHLSLSGNLKRDLTGYRYYDPDTIRHWEQTSGQLKMFRRIRAARPDVHFEAFVRSAPYYMTFSGCTAGNADGMQDNLNPEWYDLYSRYLVDILLYYRNVYNTEIWAVAPFTAPADAHQAGGKEEGCHFSQKAMKEWATKLKSGMRNRLLRNPICGTDETDLDKSIADLNYLKANDGLYPFRYWNVQTFTADSAQRSKLYQACQDNGFQIHVSASGTKGEQTIQSCLEQSQRLIDDIKQLKTPLWLDYLAIDNGEGYLTTLSAGSNGEDLQRTKNYYVRMQVTRFIPRGYRFLQVDNPHTLAALSPNQDSLIIVTQNNTDQTVEHNINLSSFNDFNTSGDGFITDTYQNCAYINNIPVKNKILRLEMKPQSILTVRLSHHI